VANTLRDYVTIKIWSGAEITLEATCRAMLGPLATQISTDTAASQKQGLQVGAEAALLRTTTSAGVEAIAGTAMAKMA